MGSQLLKGGLAGSRHSSGSGLACRARGLSGHDLGRCPERPRGAQELRARVRLRQPVLREHELLTGHFEYQERKGTQDLFRGERAMPVAAHRDRGVQEESAEATRGLGPVQ